MSMGVIVVVMIVVTMLVVMMIVITVVMVPMIIMVMAVIVRGMIVGGLRVGAPFGIERRLDLDDARAEPLYHRLDDVIAADAQALRHDLRRQMAVAEMPCDADQMQGIGAAD